MNILSDHCSVKEAEPDNVADICDNYNVLLLVGLE